MSQFDQELEELLADVVVVESHTGKDNFGNPLYASAVNVDAYVEDNISRGEPADNQATFGPEVSFSGKFWCKPDVILKPRDKVTLPSGREGFVLSVTTYRNVPERGPHHQEVNYTARN